jgi:spermidine/putrescine transport system permease protein
VSEPAQQVTAAPPATPATTAQRPAKAAKPRSLAGPALVSPMALWMLLFFAVPLLLILIYSFGYMGLYDNSVKLSLHTDAKNGVYSIWSLHAYREMFTEVYLKAAWQTFLMVLGNTLGCLLIGYPVAYWISRKTGRRKGLFILLLMVPFWTSFLVRTYSWMVLLGNEGLINKLLQGIGIINHPLTLLNTFTAVMIGLIYAYLPFMVLPLFVSIDKIDISLSEASNDLGAGKWSTLYHVTIPLSLPGIAAGCMLVAIPTTGEFIIPSLLGGDKVVNWGWLIYKCFTSYRNWALGSALSNVLMVVMLGFIAAYLWYLKRSAA